MESLERALERFADSAVRMGSEESAPVPAARTDSFRRDLLAVQNGTRTFLRALAVMIGIVFVVSIVFLFLFRDQPAAMAAISGATGVSIAWSVRRMERLSVSVRGDRVEIGARANAFCHQMMRSLVGTLLSVGTGQVPADSMPAVLEARDRAAAAQMAPAHGLTLERVRYGGSPSTR